MWGWCYAGDPGKCILNSRLVRADCFHLSQVFYELFHLDFSFNFVHATYEIRR